MGFIIAYDSTTGRKQRIPEHWLADPVIGRNFRKTPLSEKQQKEADAALAKANNDTPTDGDKE